MEYNTGREHLKLREYGRNVQNLVSHIQNESDKEKRSKHAAILVELMKQINPNFNKDSAEYDQKIWDDVFIISGFDMDVDSPFPTPEPSLLERKPERLTYFSNEIKFKHYGRSIEILIKNAIALEDPKEKEGAVIVIGKLMKSFFLTWNKDAISDELVLKNIKKMSNDQLDINIETVKELNLFDLGKPAYNKNRRNYSNNKGGKGKRPHHGGGHQGGHKGNNQNRRRHN
ncbi:MAG: DUF4290 domain-containing protein [Cytophagales bacterium]|nr:DUF4290 domain-containing protein [Cytophagales bacterium]